MKMVIKLLRHLYVTIHDRIKETFLRNLEFDRDLVILVEYALLAKKKGQMTESNLIFQYKELSDLL